MLIDEVWQLMFSKPQKFDGLSNRAFVTYKHMNINTFASCFPREVILKIKKKFSLADWQTRKPEIKCWFEGS